MSTSTKEDEEEEEEEEEASKIIGFRLASGEEQAQTLEDPLGEEEYLGQMMHTAIEVPPLVVEYFPAGHKEQVSFILVLFSFSFQYVPPGQFVQDLADLPYLPGGHAPHLDGQTSKDSTVGIFVSEARRSA